MVYSICKDLQITVFCCYSFILFIHTTSQLSASRSVSLLLPPALCTWPSAGITSRSRFLLRVRPYACGYDLRVANLRIKHCADVAARRDGARRRRPRQQSNTAKRTKLEKYGGVTCDPSCCKSMLSQEVAVVDLKSVPDTLNQTQTRPHRFLLKCVAETSPGSY